MGWGVLGYSAGCCSFAGELNIGLLRGGLEKKGGALSGVGILR